MFRSVLLCGVAASSLLTGAARAADTSAPESIVVTGSQTETVASSGTKSATPILETPQSISVVTGTDIEALGLSNLNQVLRYVAGVTPELRGANAEVYDQFKLRGFDAPRYLDGLKIFTSPTGYADTQIDVSRIERIEVVKGPASVLYGQSSPGGLVAISSKLPLQREFYGSVAASYGTFDLYRIDGDVGGKANASGTVLWRISGSINGAHTQQSFGKRRRYTISPSVTIGAGTDTSLTLLGAYSHDPDNGNYGVVPLFGSLYGNPNGHISQTFADGEPGLQRFRRNQKALTYIFNHHFGGDWNFRSSGRYQDVDAFAQGAYTNGVFSPADTHQTLFSRGALRTKERLKDWTFDNQLSGTVHTGALAHHLLFGVDYQSAHSTELAGFQFFPGSVSDIDAYNPVYGTVTLPSTYAAFDFHSDYDTHQRQTGIYAQDQIAIGGLRLTGSARYDWARGHQQEAVFGQNTVKKDHKFTYRVGALYLTDLGVAPYVSYSTSFEPQSATVLNPDGSTGLADPSLGRQIEGGVKYQPRGTDILLTAAYFHIDQTNVVVSSPVTFLSSQSGKVRSQGFEFEAKLPLFKGFDLSAAYSHQKVRTIRDDNPFNVGRPPIFVGKENASLHAGYEVQQGALTGLEIGAGVRHVGRVYGGYILNATSTAVDRAVYTHPYTLFDADLHFDLGKAHPSLKGWELGLNAANLFDKRTVTSCYVQSVGSTSGTAWCWYGQRRTVQGTIGFHW